MHSFIHFVSRAVDKLVEAKLKLDIMDIPAMGDSHPETETS